MPALFNLILKDALALSLEKSRLFTYKMPPPSEEGKPFSSQLSKIVFSGIFFMLVVTPTLIWVMLLS